MSIFDIVINFVEAFISLAFIYYVLKRNKPFISLVIATIILGLNTTLHNYFLLPEISLTVSTTLFIFLYAYYLNKYEFIQNLFVTLCSNLFLNISLSCATLFASVLFDFPFYGDGSYIFIVLTSKTINLIIVIVAIQYTQKYYLLQTKKLKFILIAMVLLDIVYGSLSDIIFYNEIFDETIIIMTFSLDFLMISFASIFLETKKEQQELLCLQKTNMQLETQEKISQLNSESIKELRKWKHDMKHIFNSLSYELDHNDIEESKKIIKEQSDIIDDISLNTHTGNTLLDYILIYRNEEIKINKITVHTDYSPCKCPLEDTHFFIIVGNLLNNAIENCRAINKKEIYITLSQNGPYLCIKVMNSITESVLETNPNLITTKDDPTHHGIGLSNVRLLVKRYNGRIDFEEDERFFIVKIIIPINQNN